MSAIARLGRRIRATWHYARCWLFLHPRVTGRLKLRGDISRIEIHPSFRCDGDLWLGVHSDIGRIIIGPDVTASGPLVVTAIRTLRIGGGTLFGPNVLVTDHYHGNSRDADHRTIPPSRRPLHSPGEIVIGDDVQLGANSVVLSPANLGRGAIIAANAAVKGDVPEMAIYTGLAGAGTQHSHEPAGETGE